MSISWVDASRFARHTKVIAVADVVESVRLMELDEEEFIRRWHGFVGFVKQRLPTDTGRMHKSLGDGLMLEFSEPEGCIRAALAMQDWFNEGNQGLPPEQHVHLRIGAHVAEYVSDENDIYGNDVNLTARIATLAGPGEIVISAALRDRIHGELEAHVEDLGACHLKHVRQPVRAYRVARAGRVGGVPNWADMRLLTRASIAVLPFVTEGGDDVLGEAVGDEAVAGLSRSGQLQVISRLSTAAFRDRRATLDEISRHLRVNYLLSGRVRQGQEQLALFAELTETATGHVVWAHSFKGTSTDLFAIDSRLVQDLVSAVLSGVLAREAERQRGQPLPSLESHTLLLGAIRVMHHLTVADMERARDMLDHLVERNRRLPSVSGWLVHGHVVRALQMWNEGADPLREAQHARADAQSALQADAECPLTLAMIGHAHLHLWREPEKARRRYAQVLAVHPDDALALQLQGELLALQGDGVAGVQVAIRALSQHSLEPMRYFHEQLAALAACIAGEQALALELAERSVNAQPRFVPGWWTLAIAQVGAQQLEAAQRTMTRLLELQPRFSIDGFLRATPAAAPVAQELARALALAGAPRLTSEPAASSST